MPFLGESGKPIKFPVDNCPAALEAGYYPGEINPVDGYFAFTIFCTEALIRTRLDFIKNCFNCQAISQKTCVVEMPVITPDKPT